MAEGSCRLVDDSTALRGLIPLLLHQEGREVLMAIDLTEDDLAHGDEAEQHGERGGFRAEGRLGLRSSAKFTIESLGFDVRRPSWRRSNT